MGILLVATLFFSETRSIPAGLLPSLGQVLSFGLLATVLANLGQGTAVGSIGRLGTANGIGQLLLVILSFAYYVSYDISMGFRSVSVLPVAGISFLIGVLAAEGSGERLMVRELGYTAVIAGAVLLALPLSTWFGWRQVEMVEIPDIFEPIVVMDFNVHNGFSRAGLLDLEAIAEVIEESGAGIVGLQEVSRGWVINGSTDMAQWLSQRLGMSYYFASTEGELWGNMSLSRYPILRADLAAYSTESLLLRRGYLVAEIDTGQSILEVTVTHFYHRGEGSDIRQVQAAEVLDGRATTAGLLMGDMNAIPDTPEMALFGQAGWIDVLSDVVPESARYTNSVDAPYQQIDYIFVTPDVAFSEPMVIQTMVSDHFPVVIRLGE
jgi:endonuclease/exonuclease/phosphatase family metal-dependent hydrolase